MDTSAIFEWDDAKRLTNIEKHALDFLDAVELFDGRPVVHVAAKTTSEDRVLTIGMRGAKTFTLIWTWRGAARRLISFRRTRNEEERIYHAHYGREG